MTGDWAHNELLPIAAVEFTIGSAIALCVNGGSHCLFPLPERPRSACSCFPSTSPSTSPPTAARHPFPDQELRGMSPSRQKQKFTQFPPMSALSPKADIDERARHVRFVPCVDGSELARRIFTLQAWSVQPCVRPLGAVHMTAGHNALRGSGPSQKPAFDDAMAQVGCPDHRIDRLCITCCSPSQPSHHASH
jgi:hypothetical protein